ncbi:hypothetical protein [uncultured Clostridium sp.]|uniref:hypothetical protein n=1 Tax=uncultured Clostridium sp. TaxID=59620 RepID=UPI0026139F21|nr:hypothetical protein [uncultured Clostridium sp.]MCI9110285.1 hypothetical protein [Bacilli bacterium]
MKNITLEKHLLELFIEDSEKEIKKLEKEAYFAYQDSDLDEGEVYDLQSKIYSKINLRKDLIEYATNKLKDLEK